MPTETFTATWVDRVKLPETGRIEYWDSKLDGFGLRVSHTGSKVWCVRYRKDGKRRRVPLGEYPVVPLGEARLRAQAVLLEAARDGDPGAAREARKKANTVEWLAAEYIEKYAIGPDPDRPRKKSWQYDEDLLRRHVLPKWKDRKAEDIRRRDVIELLDGIVSKGALIQANRTLAVVRKMFNWAVSRDVLENTPCVGVERPAVERSRDRWLDADEIRRIWPELGHIRTNAGDALKLVLITAQRCGEVKAMRWVDLDLDAGWWTIPGDMTKNGRTHRVPLSALALAILAGLKGKAKGSQWVFPSRMLDDDQHLDRVHASAQKVAKLSGVDFTPHVLRHTAATWMASLGVTRFDVGQVLNHTDQSITGVYDHFTYDDQKRKALDLWAERLMAIVG